MRILQLVDRDSSGGIPRILRSVERAGLSKGWDVKTTCWNDSKNSRWPALHGNLFQKWIALRKLISDWKPDIIHDHFGGLNAVAYQFWRPSHYKTVFHQHNEWNVHASSPDRRRKFRLGLFQKVILPRYDGIFSVSEHTRKSVKKLLPEYRRPLKVLYNAIEETDSGALSKQGARQALGLDPNRRYVLGLGRLVFEKGFLLHPDVLKKLNDAGAEYQLLLTGDGDAAFIERLKQRAQSQGVLQQTIFTGRTSKPELYFGAADCFLFASHQEPFGLTLLEAMRLECPVVAVLPEQGGGPHEFIRHEENALVCTRDPESAAASVIRVQNDSELRQKLIDGGLKTLSQFSMEVFREKLESLYDEVMTVRL